MFAFVLLSCKELFFRFYRIAAVACCVLLVAILLVAVSYLPPVGNAENPVNNEVSAKYIEDGMQDTGAVNIVAGMIFDYRAFDTFGEANVLFIATCTYFFSPVKSFTSFLI